MQRGELSLASFADQERLVVRVVDPYGEDLVGANGECDFVVGDGEGGALWLLHEVGFGGGGGSGGDGEGYVGLFAGPLEDAEDEAVVVFSFFDSGEDYVLRGDRGVGVFEWHGSGVGADLCRAEFVVVLVAAACCEGLLPCAGVRVEGVAEVLVAAVGFGVGPGGGAQEGEAKDVACGVVAVFGFVEE